MQLVRPGITPSHFDIVDKGIPCLDQRGTITLVVPIVLSMLKECVDDEFMFSAIFSGTKIKIVKLR